METVKLIIRLFKLSIVRFAYILVRLNAKVMKVLYLHYSTKYENRLTTMYKMQRVMADIIGVDITRPSEI